MQIWLAIRTCLKDKIFVTGGRSGRAEFWWFTLFTILVRAAMYPLNLVGYVAIIFSIVSFLLFIGNYTSLTRRLHDTNRSIIHCFPLVVGLLLALVGFFTNVRLAVTVGEVLAGADLRARPRCAQGQGRTEAPKTGTATASDAPQASAQIQIKANPTLIVGSAPDLVHPKRWNGVELDLKLA